MLRFHNTLGNRLEEFQPVDPEQGVRIYSCGPTVYDVAHIGNFRAYVFADLLRRYLEYRGYRVTQVMNLTDVDDKTIRDSRKEGVGLREFTDRYIRIFFEDLATMGIKAADRYPRATEHIPEMVELVQRLQEKELAYEADGSIYFRISAFPGYGKLSGVRLDKMKAGVRYDADEYEKDDVQDFVLWKGARPDEPSWETELGTGRPGWHVECSAMSTKYLGRSFDIHTGGVDNIFPHHENEIAQSEAAFGVPYVRYWLHCAFLTMGEEKMSKSLGNFRTVRELVEEGRDPMAIRYLLASGHYRKPLVFTMDMLDQAKTALDRLQELVARLGAVQADGTEDASAEPRTQEMLRRFEESMDDDLNTSGALGALFELVTDTNRALDDGRWGREGAGTVLAGLQRVNQVLGFLKFQAGELDREVEELIQARQAARQRKDWAAADELRDRLTAMGIELKDTKDGVRWKRL